jgi:hypothetical protein
MLQIVVALLALVGPPDVYQAPDRPLDDRVDPAKVTEQDPPPLPEQIILPVPPEFRVATDPGRVPIDPAQFDRVHAAVERGLRYLASTQGTGGGWLAELRAAPTDQPETPAPVSVAVTALVVKAFAQTDVAILGDARFRAALRHLDAARRDDGSFEGGVLSNYVTASVVMALATLDDDEYLDELAGAGDWLQQHQWDQDEGISARQDWFGGAGYGNRGRPDVSNTQTMLDALYEAGVSPDEPSVQRALAFISRAQNLQATNKAAWAGNDGGLVYTPANGGESMASEAAGEGRNGELIPPGRSRSLRSYGSMTYAGFKSMLYAGLSPDDIRVRAAFDWIRRNWTFDENPGLGQEGLYYYYHTMSRAMRAAQQHVVEIEGTMHNWRDELTQAILARQRADGSWQNPADRWMEGEPVIATVFAVLALEEAIKPVTPTGRRAGLDFLLTYDDTVTDTFTGRVYVMTSTGGGGEPRLGPDWFNTAPFFALDVRDWKPDTPLVFDSDALGYPVPIAEIPAGTYSIQAVMRRNPDSPFVGRGAGTAYSEVVSRELDGATDSRVQLRIDRVEGESRSQDTKRVKFIRVPSKLLSNFHGREVFMEAAVILPDAYLADDDRRYPALYFIPGFGSSHMQAVALAKLAAGINGDQIVKIGLNPLCRTGHHVFADSENNGPRGRALVEELIPFLEREFRLVAAPTARFLTGGSSGGWSSLWLQVTYPDDFGGVWSLAPDPVDFRLFQLVNLYEPGENVFRNADGSRRPIARRNGQVMAWYDDFAKMDNVIGEGGQLYSFDGAFSPRGPDGRPRPYFDRETGEVDADVVEAWKRYDIRLFLQENWTGLGPKLSGKIRILVGDADNFYLDGAVELLRDTLDTLGSDAVIEILPGRTHNLADRETLQRVDREVLEVFDAIH